MAAVTRQVLCGGVGRCLYAVELKRKEEEGISSKSRISMNVEGEGEIHYAMNQDLLPHHHFGKVWTLTARRKSAVLFTCPLRETEAD